MSYFKNFPVAVVDFSEFGEEPKEYLISDIITNVRVKTNLFANLTFYEEYDIRDGENPEIISEKFYGTPYYHWIIMLTNERYDYINDFPLPQKQLEVFIDEKYGAAANNIRHYISTAGYIVMSDYVNELGVADATPVTNFEYEVDKNESKRRIKIIPADILGEVIRQFREILK
jgi:hypothetical protein